LDDPDEEMYEQLPNWIREKLDQRVPAQSAHTANAQAPAGDTEFDDDIPF
jgi:hypothetical protein